MIPCLAPSSQIACSSRVVRSFCNASSTSNNTRSSASRSQPFPVPNLSYIQPPGFSRHIRATSVAASSMEIQQGSTADANSISTPAIKLLFVEMGVGYDQHGQDITAAAMRACRDAISSNSIPAFRRGSIPGVTFDQMKLQIKLGVPHSLQQYLDVERVNGKILTVEVVDGGLVCSSGVHVEEMGDKNDDCYIVNAAVYVGY